MTHKVHIEPLGTDIIAEDNASLKDLLSRTGIDFPCGGKGLCGNCIVQLTGGRMETSRQEESLLIRKGLAGTGSRISCLCKVTGDVSIRIPERKQVILSDDSITQNNAEEGMAIAIDLGSTTIVAQLIDREYGKVICTDTQINSQNSYGADIISRIEYALGSPENSRRLTSIVREQTGRMVNRLMEDAKNRDVRRVIIVGNSVMHHLFCGLDVSPLASWPFQSSHNEGVDFTPETLGWELPSECVISFMPNISHFVGSDILAGIYRLGIHRQDKWTALIDLGTNGEIAIGRKGRIICTSTAAGPAFEGVNITDGMRAVSGAICKVDEDTGEVSTIENAKPAGICGSGLIEAVHHFLKTGKVTREGMIADESVDKLLLSGNIFLYDRDIREFQLAKAAIATGFELLLKQLGIEIKDLEAIYVAGGLGNWLDIGKARSTGLIKSIDDMQVRKAGNSALAGCKEMTFSKSHKEIEEIMPMLMHYSLETDPCFQDVYCENLFF